MLRETITRLRNKCTITPLHPPVSRTSSRGPDSQWRRENPSPQRHSTFSGPCYEQSLRRACWVSRSLDLVSMTKDHPGNQGTAEEASSLNSVSCLQGPPPSENQAERDLRYLKINLKVTSMRFNTVQKMFRALNSYSRNPHKRTYIFSRPPVKGSYFLPLQSIY